MDYRGKILLLDLAKSGHAVEYICTGHYNGMIEIVPTVLESEVDYYEPIPLDDISIRAYWENSDLIESVKCRIRNSIRVMLRNAERGFDAEEYEAMHRNLSRIDSLNGDDPVDLSPPVPKQSPFVRPNYVGKLVFVEFPLDCNVAYESGEIIVVAQSEDSLYGVQTESCESGVCVGRIPFISGDQSIKILYAVQDDEFISEFIDRLDDMSTDNYTAASCDAAETVSRQLKRLLSSVVGTSPNVTSSSKFDTSALDQFFGSLDHAGRTCCGCCN